jgi:hypothetical protein
MNEFKNEYIQSALGKGLIYEVDLNLFGGKLADTTKDIPALYDSAVEWCSDSVGGEEIAWQSVGELFFFKNIEDAMLFKLIWC